MKDEAGQMNQIPPAASLPSQISLALIGLMCVLPYLQPWHPKLIPSFHSELLAVALGLVALGLLLQKSVWQDFRLPRIALAPLGLICVLALQLLLGMPPYAEVTLLASYYLIWATALMLLGSLLEKQIGLARIAAWLAWFLLAGGCVSALLGLLQHFQPGASLGGLLVTHRTASITGNLGQVNHYANYLALSLASLIFLYAQGKLRALYAVPLALLLLPALSLSGSRSVWLYLGALLALAIWQFLRATHPAEGATLFRPTSNNSVLVGSASAQKFLHGIALFFVCFILLQWLLAQPWFTLLHSAANPGARLLQQAGEDSIRVYLWRAAWEMFLQAPLLGVGFGNFAWEHFLLGVNLPPAGGGVYFDHAHNFFAQLLAETGLVGTLLVGVPVVLWLKGWWRHFSGSVGRMSVALSATPRTADYGRSPVSRGNATLIRPTLILQKTGRFYLALTDEG